MNKHGFCQVLLAEARLEARTKAVSLPKHITALSDGNGQFFMEAEGMEPRWLAGCCPYEVRAKLIRTLIDAAEGIDAGTKAAIENMTRELEHIDNKSPMTSGAMARAWVIMLAANVMLERLTPAQIASAVVSRLREVIGKFNTGEIVQ